MTPNNCSTVRGFKQEVLRRRWPLSLECDSVISRLQQRSHTDDHFIVNSALWNWMMNATPGTFKGGKRHSKCHIRPFETIYNNIVCVLDDPQGHLTTPPSTCIIVLHGPGSIYTGQGTSGSQCCSLMKVD
ncbi:hypothetical protein ILYODFUR_038271 [Ilyodon furcidens]|uniref:Uncharacterized protein n=1 Tax=Ilyodon furcidens TaxID=33524 RepID=A0ABV0V1K3_9TELE